MKKSLIGFLASLGCLACLAGCGTTDNSGLASAKDYIKEMYKNEATETGADFERAGFVKIDGVSYEVVWSVDVTEGVTVTKNEAGDYVIDVDENAEAAFNYVLTATIKDANGNTETLTYNHTVPKFRELTWAEFTATEDDKAVVIKGVIGGIVNTDSKHELYLQDEDGGYYVYNLDAAKMEGLQIGQEIRVRGTRDTYYGVNQVIDADVEVLNATPVEVVAEDVTEAFVAAESTKDASLVALQSKLIKITGATVLGQDASDSTYFNFKIGDKRTYVRISSSACMFSKDDQDAFKAAVAENIGKTADVTGFISVYNNAVYIIPQTKDAFSNFQVLNLTDAEKIDFEIDLMAGVKAKLTSTVELQTKGSIYEDVLITWTTDNEEVAKVEDGKLVITRPARDAEDATVKVTASVVCGEETAKTVEYEVEIPKMPSTLPLAISEAPVVGTTYKMYLEQTKLEKTLYLTGAMDGNYLASTEAQEEAADVTVKAVDGEEGKFYIYVDGAGYLNISTAVKDAEKGTFSYSVAFARDAVTKYVWDETNNTLVTDKEGNEKAYVGTYNSFETFSASAYSYISTSFPARLCTLVDADLIPEEPEITLPEQTAENTKTIDEILAMDPANLPTEAFYVTGTIKSVYKAQYGNMYITDEDGTQLTVYGSYNSDGTVGYADMTEKPDEADVVLFYSKISQYNNIPQLLDAWIVSWTPGEPVVEAGVVTIDCSKISGTQYADETHKIDDNVTISTHNKGCHFNTQLRLYDSSSNNGWAIITSTKVIKGLSFNAGNKAATLEVYGSVDGETWVKIQDVTTTAAYADHTVTIDEAAGYKYLKFDAVGAQIRIASFALTLA